MRTWTATIFLLLLPAFLFAGPGELQEGASRKPAEAAIGQNAVPFELRGGFVMLARAELGEHFPLTVVVDTGSSPSVLNRRLVEALGLLPDAIAAARPDVRRVLVPELKFGPIRLKSASLIAQNLDAVERVLGTHLDGVIGMDVLSRASFTIDYQSQSIRFGSSRNASPGVRFERESHAGLIVFEASAGGKKLRLVLDSGAGNLVLFGARVAARFPEWQGRAAAHLVKLSGEVNLRKVRIPPVTLSDRTIFKGEALVSDEHDRPLPDADGVLGLACFHARRVEFDFDRQRAWFTW